VRDAARSQSYVALARPLGCRGVRAAPGIHPLVDRPFGRHQHVSIAAFVSIADDVTIGRDVVVGPHVDRSRGVDCDGSPARLGVDPPAVPSAGA
jgi:UDP-3-O-[3-hydroxymyristoyl] glucosamine N-acyltransferase